ncbi:hypothetical protein [Aliikangiella sp. IMCC44359]|uniref:hypothetical protein n=1 Tax=Aliikangiella sp. IMCC44359 TaxID=3459125 RepID=UPI00403B0628
MFKRIILSVLLIGGIVALSVAILKINLQQATTAESQTNLVGITRLPENESKASRNPKALKAALSELEQPVVRGSQQYTEMLPENWVEVSGYNAIRQFVEIEDQAVEAVNSDYLSYDLDTLLTLAEQGDGLAQLYYAMNVKSSNPKQALQWYEKAAISTGYTAIVEKIALAHYQKAYQIALELEASDSEQSEAYTHLQKQYQEAFIQSKTWLNYGTKRGDPLIADLNDALTPNVKYLTHKALDEANIEAKGSLLYQSIIEKRNSLGLPDLPLFKAPGLSQLEAWMDTQEETDSAASTLEFNFNQER